MRTPSASFLSPEYERFASVDSLRAVWLSQGHEQMARMKKEGPVIECHTANELNRCLDRAGAQLVALLFTSTWCAPCRAIAPAYIKLAEDFPNVVFLRADANELKRVAIDCGVESLPTIIFLRDRRILDRLVGADKSELELMKKVLSHLSTNPEFMQRVITSMQEKIED